MEQNKSDDSSNEPGWFVRFWIAIAVVLFFVIMVISKQYVLDWLVHK